MSSDDHTHCEQCSKRIEIENGYLPPAQECSDQNGGVYLCKVCHYKIRSEPDYIGEMAEGVTIYVQHSLVSNPGWKWVVLKRSKVIFDSDYKFFSSAQAAMRDVQAFLAKDKSKRDEVARSEV